MRIPDAAFRNPDLSWGAMVFLAFLGAGREGTLVGLGVEMRGASKRTVQGWIDELERHGFVTCTRTGRGLRIDTQKAATQTRRNLPVGDAESCASDTQEPATREAQDSASLGRGADLRVSETQVSSHRVARARASEKISLEDRSVAADLDAREPESSSSVESLSDDLERLWRAWAERYERHRGARPIRRRADDLELAPIATSIAEHASRDGIAFDVLAARALKLYWSRPWTRHRSNRPTTANLAGFFDEHLAAARRELRPAPAKVREPAPRVELGGPVPEENGDHASAILAQLAARP